MEYAITGVTGTVGGELARNLLAAGDSVRAIVRDANKGRVWGERGCSVSLATMEDAGAMARAFAGASGVFILLPPNFDPSPGFPEVRRIVAALRTALLAAKPPKVVCLSTIGAQAAHENLLTSLSIAEETLGTVPMPIAFLRPAWFIENSRWDVSAARESGVVPSFLQPLDKPFPMVATVDVASTAAGLLRDTWIGRRVVELEGPSRVSPNEIAEAFAKLLGKPVRMEAVPRETWSALFEAQGMKNPRPRARMLDGFNEGWIDFESGAAGSIKGATPLERVLKGLLAQEN